MCTVLHTHDTIRLWHRQSNVITAIKTSSSCNARRFGIVIILLLKRWKSIRGDSESETSLRAATNRRSRCVQIYAFNNKPTRAHIARCVHRAHNSQRHQMWRAHTHTSADTNQPSSSSPSSSSSSSGSIGIDVSHWGTRHRASRANAQTLTYATSIRCRHLSCERKRAHSRDNKWQK